MARGDHVKVKRMGGLYTHHGIDVGNGRIIHFSGEVGRKRNAAVVLATRSEFAAGGDIEVVSYASSDSADQVVNRARSRLGESGYDLFGNNCEHFARWCKTGQKRSEQVADAASGAFGVGGGGAATAAGVGVVSATGAVAGLSGAGVMSGLATVGGVVGGGAVAGVGLLGVGPAAVSTVVMHHVLKDDEHLPSAERQARAAGRVATTAGAVAGTAGAITAISTAGTVAGLSGAGITSGLAAIGATVGGGMAAGTAMTVAAPAVAAVAIGYGIYRLCRWVCG